MLKQHRDIFCLTLERQSCLLSSWQAEVEVEDSEPGPLISYYTDSQGVNCVHIRVDRAHSYWCGVVA
jgi:hypothetical protein